MHHPTGKCKNEQVEIQNRESDMHFPTGKCKNEQAEIPNRESDMHHRTPKYKNKQAEIKKHKSGMQVSNDKPHDLLFPINWLTKSTTAWYFRTIISRRFSNSSVQC